MPDGGGGERSYAARVRLLYAGVGTIFVSNLAISSILAMVHRDVVDRRIVAGWFLFLLASSVWRVVLVTWFRRRNPPDAEMRVWGRRYVIAAGWTGVGWGAAGLVLLPESSIPHQVVTAFVIGGMASAAMTTLSRLYAAYVVYVVAMLPVLSIRFAMFGGEIGVAFSIMTTLMLLFLLYSARIQSATLGRSLDLALKHEDLVGDLTEQTGVAMRLNQDLRRQIEERRRIERDLREREASLANAQKIAGLGSWDWDSRTNEVRLSDQAYRIFGLEKKQEPPTYDMIVSRIPADDRKRVEAKITQALEDGRPYSVQHRIRHPDNVERVVMERAQVVYDDKDRIIGLTGTAHDVTEQYRVNQELQRTTDVAEAANEAKSRFLANMSHEFRTPLNAIIGYSEILREDAAEQGELQSLQDLERINSAGRHLLTLVNEILDLSKIEAGKTELFIEPFAVSDIVDDVASTSRPLIEAKGNSLVVDCPADVGIMRADPTKVRQILYNLLSNAGKFTDDGEITVRVWRDRDPGANKSEWIQIQVADSGIGMAPDQTESAFKAFGQLDSSATRKYGGTGLGLAITRHYCELMGGAITVDSLPNQGSVFSVRLPATVTAPDGSRNEQNDESEEQAVRDSI